MIPPKSWQEEVMNLLATSIEDFMKDPVHTPDLFVQWIRRLAMVGLVRSGALYFSENEGLRLKAAVTEGPERREITTYPDFISPTEPVASRLKGILECLENGCPHTNLPDIFIPLIREKQTIGALTLTPSSPPMIRRREGVPEDLEYIFRLLSLALGLKETSEKLRKAEDQTRSIL